MQLTLLSMEMPCWAVRCGWRRRDTRNQFKSTQCCLSVLLGHMDPDLKENPVLIFLLATARSKWGYTLEKVLFAMCPACGVITNVYFYWCLKPEVLAFGHYKNGCLFYSHFTFHMLETSPCFVDAWAGGYHFIGRYCEVFFFLLRTTWFWSGWPHY